MLVGYARVSTHEQSLALQQDALVAAGCGRTYTDVVSGVAVERAGLAAALDYVRPGDTLVVWRLDRLGRSLRHLIEQVTALESREVGFRSLTEAIDTTTSGGKLISHIFGGGWAAPWRSSSATSSGSAPRPGWPRRGRAAASAGARGR